MGGTVTGANRAAYASTITGPVLVDGPVELVTEDGTVVRSDRVVVAVCACRRSKRFPLCDTSHRRRVRRDGSQE
ncbi:hypothetical protein ALI144C_07645 [Actinosynnema sp. ALI-1.44]|nr:hypothetical protein ALI144C_07645 [Actinosynnema sp. ALI-1.44]